MPEEKFTSYKNLFYLIIAVVIVVGAYSFISNFPNNPKQASKEISSNAYFSPPSVKDEQSSFVGSVQKSLITGNQKNQYTLVGDDGSLIGYLTSSDIDFSFSLGLKVEVNGKLVDQSSDGYAIIEVESMKFK